jgi:hypothetical protein
MVCISEESECDNGKPLDPVSCVIQTLYENRNEQHPQRCCAGIYPTPMSEPAEG